MSLVEGKIGGYVVVCGDVRVGLKVREVFIVKVNNGLNTLFPNSKKVLNKNTSENLILGNVWEILDLI